MALMENPYLPAPGRERPDYTAFLSPAGSVVDTAVEEIEMDQALSLQGRQGRDFLGMFVEGWLGIMRTEHLTIGTADHDMDGTWEINSRTGGFVLSDPEQIWRMRILQATTAPTTATSETLNPVAEGGNVIGEPELYVAPRLFYRFVNNFDATVAANSFSNRMASVSRRLTFQLFIELLERFADVTLL